RRTVCAEGCKRVAGLAHASGDARMQGEEGLQPGTDGARDADQWRRFFRLDGRAPARVRYVRRQGDLGFRHATRLRDGEWRESAWRVDERDWADDRGRDDVRQFRVCAVDGDGGERVAGVYEVT